MNIAYVVKINKDDEKNPYTLYNRKNEYISNEDYDMIDEYPKVTITGYIKKETKYDKYHIIQYTTDVDIIYLVKNPIESVFLAIYYNDDIQGFFNEYDKIEDDDESDDLVAKTIKMQYIEPYMLFLLAESVGKMTDDKVIDNLTSKIKKPKKHK
jgi:hypothetical protein